MAKVLIADDDEALRKLYQVELANKGYTVVTSIDGEDCIQKAIAEKPDIILLDVMMPKKDGVETLRSLKENSDVANIPVLMLTNFGQEDLIKNALGLGAIDYLLKYKITPSEMAIKIGQFLQPANVQR